jgi:NAD(P)-dependent dehydrogenase (short-subunit alcohol dehydrogenase family)
VIVAEIDDDLGRGAEAQLRDVGGEATFIRTDCARSADVQAMVQRTESLYGGLHVLYNNASVFLNKLDGPVTAVAEDVWTRILGVNLTSVFLCSKYAIPLMVASGGGSVINTGSSASVMGIPGCDAYTATKGATVALTRSMAVEYGPKKLRVNCICPAGIETEMVKASNLDNPDFDAEYFFRRAPLGRLGTPDEIAHLAVFLASDESSYLNGAIIRADGGITVTPIS